jgi:hypothetical protein
MSPFEAAVFCAGATLGGMAMCVVCGVLCVWSWLLHPLGSTSDEPTRLQQLWCGYLFVLPVVGALYVCLWAGLFVCGGFFLRRLTRRYAAGAPILPTVGYMLAFGLPVFGVLVVFKSSGKFLDAKALAQEKRATAREAAAEGAALRASRSTASAVAAASQETAAAAEHRALGESLGVHVHAPVAGAPPPGQAAEGGDDEAGSLDLQTAVERTVREGRSLCPTSPTGHLTCCLTGAHVAFGVVALCGPCAQVRLYALYGFLAQCFFVAAGVLIVFGAYFWLGDFT